MPCNAYDDMAVVVFKHPGVTLLDPSRFFPRRYMWSIRDLDLESMISFSTRVTRFDQTQYNDK